MNISLRRADHHDAALIADISRQTFYDTFAADNKAEDMEKFLSEQFTRDTLMMEVGLKEHLFLLAYVGDTIAGYVKLKSGKKPPNIKSAAIEIARLYVVTEFIGKGVGKRLMQACIDEAIKQARHTVWLCVWERNQRAINFYTAWGFKKFGECKFVLGNDVQLDWLMKKDLP